MVTLESRAVHECAAGTIHGLRREATTVFKGIPFATADRLAAPVDATSWSGILDASSFRAQSPQNAGALEQMLGGSSLPSAEDCLHLNVYTPTCDDEHRPVLFWIHGGAFLTGGGAMPWYDGSSLAAGGDVVVVTINYRLGMFGFLGDRNTGLLDQVSALRWVGRNIEAFGGDPTNVTIFGESAGGSAAIALMATPSADDLFHRVWAMSPSIPQLRESRHGARFEAQFLEALGATPSTDAMTASVDDLLRAQAILEGQATGALRTFAPTSGTASVPDPILDVAVRDRRPVVVGTTKDESALFSAFNPSRADWDDADVEREFGIRFGDRATAVADAYREHRPDATANELVTAMETDQIFRWPAWSLASDRADTATGAPTWMYAFDYETPSFGGVLGSCHGLDIPFAFDNLHRPGVEMFVGEGDGRERVADQYSTALLRFAHDGDPGWAAYDPDTRATMRIGPETLVVHDPAADLRQIWQEHSAPSTDIRSLT